MAETVEISGIGVGHGCPPFVIAELSGNHNGDLGRALALMAAAKDTGADAVKLQTYTAETMTIRSDRPEFRIEGGLWHGYTLYDLYEWAHTPWEWHEALFAKGRALGITVFSTPFDPTAVDFLERFDPPVYKIASFELTDLPLIRNVASRGKPMILSTGMASEKEIEEALVSAREVGCESLILLHCISGYPTPPEEMNLRRIPELARRFAVPVGLSDHTLSNTAAVAAVALGACMVEKHFTMRRSDGGPDAVFSLEPAELADLVSQCRTAWLTLGDGSPTRSASEEAALTFRRSLFAVRDIAAGELLTEQNVRAIRPGHGLTPRHLSDILGHRARTAIARGTPLTWPLVDDTR